MAMSGIPDTTGNLAFVSSSKATTVFGGSEDLWSQSALRLAQQGHRVFVNYHYYEPLHPVLDALQTAGVMLDRRRPISPPPIGKRILRKMLRLPRETDAQRERQWLIKSEPSLVCISQEMTFDGLHWMLRCLEMDIPYVVVAHSVSHTTWPDERLIQDLLKGYQGARCCFFVSEASRRLFEDQIGEDLNNARIVRNPFKVPYDLRLPWPDTSHGWRLGCVGRLQPATKGQDLLLRVLARDKWRQRNLTVGLYGGGSGEAALRRLAQRLGLHSVEFEGHTADIEQVWCKSHALVMPSRIENLPLSLVEAMLCARMAVVTDVGGIAELVTNGVSGFVSPAATVPLLDQALEVAWGKREDWQRMGTEARKAVEAFTSSDPVAEFCRQLLGFLG
jgi:glycosyltransferase involved in cell wall biosynthesis